jgi:hypothetical protein
MKPWKMVGTHRIFLSRHNQILGSYVGLRQFRNTHYGEYGKNDSQHSWEAHHILELNQLITFNIREKFPSDDDCLCVLIPKMAHIRINKDFSSYTRKFTDMSFVLQGYKDAYSNLGNYTGSGESEIRQELYKLVEVSLKLAGKF